jgi:hypothetical protein
MSENIRVASIGDLPFLFLNDESGVRIINVEHIKSLVPNFRLGGTMIFMTHSDKAITVNIDPELIAAALLNR